MTAPLVSGPHGMAGKRSGIPLSAFLTRLIWLCVLPLVLLAIWLATDSVLTAQTERDLQAANVVKNLATAIDHHLNARIGALHMLAVSPLVDDASRWKDLYQEAQGFRQSFGGHVIFADAGMHMLFNTRVPFGTPLLLLPRPAGRAAAPTVLETGKPAVGDSFLGPIAKEPLVAIAVPAQRGGKTAFLLLSIFETRQFQDRLDQVALPSGWSLTLLDGKDELIARRAPAGMNPAADVDAAGRFVVKSAVAPWSVVLEIPREIYRAPLLAATAAMVAVILGATLVAVLGGTLASRRLGRVVAALASTPAPGTPAPDIREIAAARRLLNETAAMREAAITALRESEANFHAMFDGIFDAIVYADPERRIRLVNPAFTRMFGYSAEEVIGRTTEFLYADRADYGDQGRRRFHDEARAESGVYELRYRRKDGSEFWAETSGTRILGPNGAVLGLLGVHRDISERKQAEEALRESDATYRSLFDNMLNGFAYCRMLFIDGVPQDFIYLNVNEAFETLTGLRNVVGRKVSEAILGIRETDPELFEIYGRVSLTAQPVRFERYVKALRMWFWISVYSPKHEHFVAVFDVITERKQAEAALRESEERLRLFIEHAPAALAMFDREMRYLAVSRRWMADYGLEDRDITGRSHYEVFPDIPESWKAVHRRGLEGEVVRADEDAFKRMDGTVQWLRWEVRPWRTADGAVGGIVIFSEDITERKRAEDEIHRLNAGLERRVAERTTELSAANRELESFAYAVSHDLRAPLRAMSGFSHALVEDYGDKIEGEAKGYLDQIGLASRKMGELIDGILALSRSTRGELRRDSIDISALATRLLEELKRSEPERKVSWQVEPDLRAMGDARMIEAVLRNLLGNAWKYTAHAAAPSIRVYAEDHDGAHCYCVADNGAGFDMAHAGQLFKPFQRLHRQDEFPGIGIGLATVQRIVHRHGGEIHAEGKPGAGATFCFNLPAGRMEESSRRLETHDASR